MMILTLRLFRASRTLFQVISLSVLTPLLSWLESRLLRFPSSSLLDAPGKAAEAGPHAWASDQPSSNSFLCCCYKVLCSGPLGNFCDAVSCANCRISAK